MSDFRYALRTLVRSPGFTAVAVLTLALGIGANTAMFSIVNAVLLRPLPVAEPSRLVFVFDGTPTSPYGSSSYPNYVEYRDHNEVFATLAAYARITVSLTSGDRAESMSGSIVTGNYFAALGVQAALGRTFAADEDRTPGRYPVVVIGHGLWQRRFGGSPDVVGQHLALNGQPFTIIGVMPEGFDGAEVFETNDLYVPMMMQAVVRPPRAGYSGEMDPDLLTRRSASWLRMIGRLKPGLSVERAQAGIATVARQLAHAYPNEDQDLVATVFPVSKVDPRAYPQLVSVAALLLAVVGLVLLIACANVANLLLARASARRKEIAIRLGIGASRARLVRQLLTESVLLASMAGLVGLLFALWVTDLLQAAPPPAGMFGFRLDYHLDVRVLAFTLGLSLLTGIVFGLAPALQAARSDLVSALKEEPLSPARERRFSLRNQLVVVQVALSVVLLIGTGLFLRSLEYAHAIDPGFEADQVLTVPLNINLLRYTRLQGQDFYRRAIEHVEGLPGVRSASLARVVPLSGGSRTGSVVIAGQTNAADASPRGEPERTGDDVSMNVVGLNYFRTMGIALVRGRDFRAQDAEGAPGVAIVNETFARRFLAGQDPVGRLVRFRTAPGPWVEIIGVARDSKYRTLGEAPTPFAYLPLAQNHETGMTLHVRTATDPSAVAAVVRHEVQALDRNLPVPVLEPLAAFVGGSLFPARMAAVLLGAFGTLALLLASVGLYGLMSYVVARRTREIGIRMTLGARRGDVLRLVLGDGMGLVAAGVAIGCAVAAGVSRLLVSFLYGVGPIDVVTFATIPVVLAAAALLATYVPARRAARVDPIAALRYE